MRLPLWQEKQMARWSLLLLAGGILALAASVSCSSLSQKATPERVPYSTFQRYLDTH